MKWDALHAVNSPLLEVFKPKLAIGQGYFRCNSIITRVTGLESQHFRSEGNLRDLLVQSPILYVWTGEVIIQGSTACSGEQGTEHGLFQSSENPCYSKCVWSMDWQHQHHPGTC